MAQVRATEQMARFALETDVTDIGEVGMHAAMRLCADTLACIVAGFDTDIGRRLVDLKASVGGRPDASAVVSGQKLPAASVTYVHAQLANALDAEETFFNRAHFASVVVAPVLALAEASDASAEEALAAVAVGYDVAARINLSMQASMWDPDQGVQFAGPWGHSYAAFGAAAAAGRLLDLSIEQLTHAFGIAYMSAPLHTTWMVFPRGVPRTMTKYSMYGEIAEAGLNAAELAARGFTGNLQALDPAQEFWRGFAAKGCDYDAMFKDLGEHWYVTDVAYKPYPNGRHTNLALDLLTHIVTDEALSPDEIDRITVTLPPGGVTDEVMRDLPDRSQLDATFTVKYAVSAVAHGWKPGPVWLDPANYAGESTRRFEEKVDIVVNQDWQHVLTDQVRDEGWIRRLPTRVEVVARGTSFHREGEIPFGDPWDESTYMSDDLLRDKFVEYTRFAVGDAGAHAAADIAFNLHRDKASVADLMSALTRRSG